MNNNTENGSKTSILIIATVTAFMTAFMGSSINVALPAIGKEFNVSAVLLSWFATSYLLTSAVFLVPVGKLSDMYGRVKFFKIGIIIFTFGSFLCGIANSGELLLIFRGLQGVGSSMIFTTSTAILVSAFPPNQRGKVIGINVASVYIGLSTGPFIGGFITQTIGWRYIFYITLILGIVLIFFTWLKLKFEWKEDVRERFDTAGSLIYVLSLISLMLGFTFLPKVNGYILLIIGLAGLFYFFRYEKEKSNAVFNARLFLSNKIFTFSNIAALINYSATSAISFLMSLYLQHVKLLSPQDAGLILVTQPLMMALFSPLTGRLSDKYEPQHVASTGMGLITICLLVFVFLTANFPYYIIVINLAVLGIGFALFSSPNMNAIMGSVDKRYYGVASSTLASMRLIGQMFSMGIVIVIFSVLIGKAEISPQISETFISSARIAFGLFSFLCFIGIFASISRGKMH
ncbi:MAG: MFS transporter [Ignavibacteriae bacterium]|nr:MAG: MFS transporter [Ignavibacteriota bacterium]